MVDEVFSYCSKKKCRIRRVLLSFNSNWQQQSLQGKNRRERSTPVCCHQEEKPGRWPDTVQEFIQPSSKSRGFVHVWHMNKERSLQWGSGSSSSLVEQLALTDCSCSACRTDGESPCLKNRIICFCFINNLLKSRFFPLSGCAACISDYLMTLVCFLVGVYVFLNSFSNRSIPVVFSGEPVSMQAARPKITTS